MNLNRSPSDRADRIREALYYDLPRPPVDDLLPPGSVVLTPSDGDVQGLISWSQAIMEQTERDRYIEAGWYRTAAIKVAEKALSLFPEEPS